MATTPKAIKYIVNKRPFAAALTFTGDDTTVDNEWTQLTVTTPGIMTDGTQVVYAQKFDPAVLNSNNVCIFGSVSATFPSSGVTPSDQTPNQVQTGAVTLSNGANNNVVGVSSANLVFIDGPSSSFSITGIAGGVDGSTVTLYNTTSQAMTIANNSGSSSTGNKILTGTGADVVLSGNGAITLEYKSNSSQWVVTGISEIPGAGGVLSVAGGGTGVATLTAHGVVIGEGTSAVAVTSAGTAGQALLSGGASADPNWGNVPNLVSAPATAASTGTAGQVAYDATHWYVCIATDTWVRVATATW